MKYQNVAVHDIEIIDIEKMNHFMYTNTSIFLEGGLYNMNGLDIIDNVENTQSSDDNYQWHESWGDSWTDSHR